jgi:hypothetical protein
MVAIGVTGHRVVAEPGRVLRGIDRALDRIGESFPDEPWTIASALAEGADRMIVQRALLRPATRLVAVLPLARADYVADFDSPESRQEFEALLERADEVIELPAPSKRDEAYEAAAQYVLDYADVVVAVWDGLPAQGQGGTGEVVLSARERGLPLAWVRAGNRAPGTMRPASLGAEQGEVSFEGF